MLSLLAIFTCILACVFGMKRAADFSSDLKDLMLEDWMLRTEEGQAFSPIYKVHLGNLSFTINGPSAKSEAYEIVRLQTFTGLGILCLKYSNPAATTSNSSPSVLRQPSSLILIYNLKSGRIYHCTFLDDFVVDKLCVVENPLIRTLGFGDSATFSSAESRLDGLYRGLWDLVITGRHLVGPARQRVLCMLHLNSAASFQGPAETTDEHPFKRQKLYQTAPTAKNEFFSSRHYSCPFVPIDYSIALLQELRFAGPTPISIFSPSPKSFLWVDSLLNINGFHVAPGPLSQAAASERAPFPLINFLEHEYAADLLPKRENSFWSENLLSSDDAFVHGCYIIDADSIFIAVEIFSQMSIFYQVWSRSNDGSDKMFHMLCSQKASNSYFEEITDGRMGNLGFISLNARLENVLDLLLFSNSQGHGATFIQILSICLPSSDVDSAPRISIGPFIPPRVIFMQFSGLHHNLCVANLIHYERQRNFLLFTCSRNYIYWLDCNLLDMSVNMDVSESILSTTDLSLRNMEIDVPVIFNPINAQFLCGHGDQMSRALLLTPCLYFYRSFISCVVPFLLLIPKHHHHPSSLHPLTKITLDSVEDPSSCQFSPRRVLSLQDLLKWRVVQYISADVDVHQGIAVAEARNNRVDIHSLEFAAVKELYDSHDFIDSVVLNYFVLLGI